MQQCDSPISQWNYPSSSHQGMVLQCECHYVWFPNMTDKTQEMLMGTLILSVCFSIYSNRHQLQDNEHWRKTATQHCYRAHGQHTNAFTATPQPYSWTPDFGFLTWYLFNVPLQQTQHSWNDDTLNLFPSEIVEHKHVALCFTLRLTEHI